MSGKPALRSLGSASRHAIRSRLPARCDCATAARRFRSRPDRRRRADRPSTGGGPGRQPDRFRTLVIGGPQSGPLFSDVPFQAAKPVPWLPANPNRRYAAGVRVSVAAAPSRADRGAQPRRDRARSRPPLPATPVEPVPAQRPAGDGRPARPRPSGEPAARLARVVTVSEFVRRRMLERWRAAPGRAPAVLPNCIDLSLLPPPLPLETRENLVLFVGRSGGGEGAGYFRRGLRRCAAALPGWRAEMIGADRFRPAGRTRRLIRALRRRGGGRRRRMSGYRPHAEVLAAMARAAIVVVPSRWPEPFGLTALEAMACGAALVCCAARRAAGGGRRRGGIRRSGRPLCRRRGDRGAG